YFAYILIKLGVSEIEFPNPTNSVWVNPLRHLLLVFIAISTKLLAGVVAETQFSLEYPLEHIQQFLKDHVEPIQPRISRAVKNFLEDWIASLEPTLTFNLINSLRR
ncbi:hypothetical protein JCM3765_006972, partial [Sporobolomyces pararoseus]